MRTSFRFIARAAALAATLVVGAACTERVLVPQTQAVQLQLELASQVAGGSRTVTVRVRYQTASGGLVALLDQTSTVATGTQQLSVPVDLSKCLADAAHVGGPTTCRLRVTVELRDAASGTLLDTVELAAIDASPGAAPAATTVTVAAVSTITVTGVSATLIQGQAAQATGVVKDAAGNTLARPITWATSNAAVAVVSGAGLVTAVAPGTVQIVASSGGVSQSTSVTVLPAVASISVNPSSASMFTGQTTQLVPTLRDANNNVLSGRPVTYSSSSAGVAAVSSSGLVSAIASGTAVITVASEGRTATVSITVSPMPLASVTPTSVSATHTFGQSSCPQAVGTITITTTSGVAVNFTASVPHASLRLATAAGSPSSSVSGGAAAGGTAQIAVSFNCASSQSVTSSVTVVVRNQANTITETYTVQVSVPVVVP